MNYRTHTLNRADRQGGAGREWGGGGGVCVEEARGEGGEWGGGVLGNTSNLSSANLTHTNLKETQNSPAQYK